ncbi:MAG: vWA domain-containing protein [Gaiellaceae bacterium]
MDVRFLTPLGAVFAVTLLVPLAVLVLRERRARSVRAALGLAQPPLRALLPLAAALAAAPCVLALAAMQPIIETTRTIEERTDAELFVVADVSRSMLASSRSGAPTRLERVQAHAERLRAQLPGVPVGILSLTDRLLPHLFPTVDESVFRSTLLKSLGIERPPPAFFFSTRATQLSALAGIPERGFFSPSARKRVLVVYTDGETRPVDAELTRAFARTPRVATLFVHVWDEDERIYETGVAERGYTPDPASAAELRRAGELVRGRVFAESNAAAAGTAAKELLGDGPTRARVLEGERRALTPYATMLALLPLGLVLLRRNL